MGRGRRPAHVWGWVALLSLLSGQVSAQAQSTAGVIQGRVVDAQSGDPLASADVTLSRRAGVGRGTTSTGTGAAPESADSVRWVVLSSTTTDQTGAYSFRDVGPGGYRLHVARPGYRIRELDVRVSAGPRPRVSVALDVVPIELIPLAVSVEGRGRVVDLNGREVPAGRISTVRLRQERYLASDARVLVSADVAESPTLGEPDVFRALQRLPGVSTRDDFSAELWTRGADWGQTRVYLDGVPLFNPVHGFGVLSGVSNRLISSITLHPGVRPSVYPEGGAAVVDLRSRSGLGEDGITGGVDVSLASAQAWSAGSLGDGGGWSAGLRRSWVDAVAAALSSDPTEQVPYAFWDLQASVTAPVSERHTLTASLLVERDRIRGEIPDVLQRTLSSWGNVGAMAGLEGHLRPGVRYRQWVGGTAYNATVEAIDGVFDSIFGAPSEAPADHAVRYAIVAGELVAERGGRWGVGYDLVHQTARYEGPETWPYSTTPPDLPHVSTDHSLTTVGLWGRQRWTVAPRVTLEGGLRVAGGGRLAGRRLDIAPNGAVRYRPTPTVSLVAGAGRYLQYAQSPTPVGPRIENVLQTGRRWMLAHGRQGPVRSDIVSLGGESWIGTSWLASATLYSRSSRNVLLPDPSPGLLVQRSPLASGRTEARGLELSARRLAGRVTGSAAYTLARADADVVGVRVPAPTDRTHVVDVSSVIALGRRAHLSAAFTYASGAPYTRVLQCVSENCQGVTLDDPFLRRAPTYASLDLMFDTSHDFGGWSLGWFVQARNVLGHDNAITYEETNLLCPGDTQSTPCLDGAAPQLIDRFTAGIPSLPLLGFRVTF